MRAELLRRRAGQARRFKRVGPAAEAVLAAASTLLTGDGSSAPPALLRAITASKAPQTWNRYMGPIRPWREFAEARGQPWLPAEPRLFAEFLAECGGGTLGYSQTKSRVNAIRALSEAAGVASPADHPLIKAVRAASCRAPRARRGPSTPIFETEIPILLSPERASAGGRAGPGLSARTQRARCAAAAHMAVLHAGALRYDDTLEGQLGDCLFFPDLVLVSVFGTKTDPELAGQPATLPREGRGAAGLVRNARYGLERLLALDPETIGVLGSRLASALGPAGRAGAEALASWPAPIPELAARLLAAGLMAHALPVFGRWLFEPLDPTSDLTESLSTGEFARLSRAVLADAGVATLRVAAHSFRRGRAVGLFHACVGREMVSESLRHRSLRSADAYILTTARMSALAGAMRVADGAGRWSVPVPGHVASSGGGGPLPPSLRAGHGAAGGQAPAPSMGRGSANLPPDGSVYRLHVVDGPP